MSDMASLPLCASQTTQLPIYSYFDPAVYKQEQARLFAHAPHYYGHELMVPNEGDYHTLVGGYHGKMLKRVAGKVHLLSNICRHRQAQIYQGRGNGQHIVCNLHGWTYNNTGQLIGAPHFSSPPCTELEEIPLTSWNGLLFDAKHNVARDLANLSVASYFSFEEYAFHRVEVTEYAFNWKTFIEVYSEDYHVDPFHPGLGHFVDCSELKWEWGEQYHAQTVGVKSQLAQPGSRVYSAWHQEVLRRYENGSPEYGAIWLTYYPNIMVEWYPHVLVIGVVIPCAVDRCRVVTEFYYPEEIVYFEPEFIEAEQAAYAETAKEDDEICTRMHRGRQALWLHKKNEVGPYQIPTEEGMRHFHQYYRRMMMAENRGQKRESR